MSPHRPAPPSRPRPARIALRYVDENASAHTPDYRTAAGTAPRLELRWRWVNVYTSLRVVLMSGTLGMVFLLLGARHGWFEVSFHALLKILFVGSGAFYITYITVAEILNHTQITVSRDSLTVRHGPVPWSGNCTLDVRRIRGFQAEHYKPLRGSAHFRLRVLFTDGQDTLLLDTWLTEEHALFLQEVLSKQLGLENAGTVITSASPA
ncbi:hypothetical protein [Chondromyces crocatus]|uniref:Uncharacterized protein n=1 Tax=Chondromyces crocatus TaxID=52 RepID=A0A0K1ET12_CHOCO|nr:hypothetical protein [Chondromyces crocatus]AKT44006.1 uncharacterized protein CMC5_082440 [Chondromyces crocatus]